MKANIHPSLATLATPVDGLTPDPRNARLHDARNVAEIVRSYAKHGQRKPIVVQLRADDGTPMVVRDGNGQLTAVKELGWTHIAALVVDEPDLDAKAYAVRVNRTAELADWDWRVVAEETAAFEQAGLAFEELGFTPAELDPLRHTDWFRAATGQLEDHTRDRPGGGGAGGTPGPGNEEVTITGKDAENFREAMATMRERFAEPGMNPGHVVGRLARHYLATMTHSRAPVD